MSIWERIFGKRKKKDKDAEKAKAAEEAKVEEVDAEQGEAECWYNNAYEEGEAARNSSVAPESMGSENFYEAALTESGVNKSC